MEGTEAVWIHVDFEELLRVVHVSQEIQLIPYLQHHVFIGVLQFNELKLKNPRDHRWIPIFDSRDHRRTSTSFKTIDVGFHSHNIRPSVIASEVMYTVFYEYEANGEGDGNTAKLKTFQLITLGRLE